MNILKTSKLIKSAHEDEDDYDPDNIDYDFEFNMLYNVFATNKNLKIDFDIAKDYLDKFEKLHVSGVFKNFQKPSIQEYFCQQLNYLLLIDFMLSFFRVSDKTFNIKNITTHFIFDFFGKLGDFFNLLLFLDVDDNVINYLKYMITLYILQLDRDIIEKHYYYCIDILDEFFVNVIMPDVLKEFNFNSMFQAYEPIKKLKESKQTADIVNEYNENNDYDSDKYVFLNSYFKYNSWGYSQLIEDKQERIEVPNPQYIPGFNVLNNHNNDYDSDNYDSDGYGYDSEEDIRTKPTIKKSVNLLEKTDPNYEEYFKIFTLRTYKGLLINYNKLLNESKELCKNVRIKDYSKFNYSKFNIEDNNYITKVKRIAEIKTALGVQVIEEFKSNNFSLNDYFKVICNYGHFKLAKEFFSNVKLEELSISSLIENAGYSPNREILKYVINLLNSNEKYKSKLEKYNSESFYEPTISFTY